MSSTFDDAQGNGRGPHGAGDEFMIVGLGASAGGIHAFKQFFENVPAESGMAYVVILHLSPDHDSRLAEVLQSSTTMTVTQVREAVKIEPDHVYVIPPNRSLSMLDGTLVLADVTSVEVRRAPVDIFFRALGDSHGARSACVVLSGTGADGSMGLKRVKERGGVAVVQDPAEAEFPDMPRNSIATGLVDYVLPVAEMPGRIMAYRDSLAPLSAGTGDPLAAEGHEEEPPRGPDQEEEEQAIASIITQLRLRTGHDFSNYKRPTLRRRIERRVGITQVADVPEYAAFIRQHMEETRALLKDLLISVTNFFRDRDAFLTLEKNIIPRLFENKGVGGYVRVWTVGCATGEEAYSIAMLLSEYAETLSTPPAVQVFASDIDEAAIQAARAGFYTLNDAADVPPERLRRFFTKVRNGYVVRRELRELVLFANHNVLKDPPFSHIDLISCRNLLIYLNRAGQEKAMSIFHFALNPAGYLFLGASETATDNTDLFATSDKEAHIFQGRVATGRPALPVMPPEPPRPTSARLSSAHEESQQAARAQHRRSYLDLHQRLLEVYAPPSVLVSSEHDIVHLSEKAGRYMHLPGGEPSYNLLAVVLPELRPELRAALFQAAQSHMSVEVPGVSVLVNDNPETVNIVVRPVVGADDTARGFFLVLFEPAEAPAEDAARAVRAAEPVAGRLEEELSHLKEQLRSTIELYEVQHEELRASNEELQAINEELRSTAEELETSKEELQSLNEELTTVNQELKIKIYELGQTNDDLQNLIGSTDLATVFLDRGLRVKLFTPRARDLFNLIQSDVGRPLSDLNAQLDDVELGVEVERVLRDLNTVEREVATRGGRWHLMRLSPYRTDDDRILGVTLTFLDITERRKVDEALREAQESLELALEAARMGVWDVDLTTGVARAGLRHSQIFGYAAPVELWGHDDFRERIIPEDREEFERSFARALETGVLELQARVRRPGGGVHWVHDRGRVYYDDRKRPLRMAGVTVDITERKEIEGRLKGSEERLRQLVDGAEEYAIFSTDAEGRVESWNTGAELIFGYKSAEILGVHFGILFTPEDRAQGADMQELRTALDKGRAADERWHARKDGSRFYASGVLSPLGEGPASGFVKVLRDLTEQKHADEELRRMRSELERHVGERTQELSRTVETMLTEVKERRGAEEHARNLVGQLVTAQEDERRRISRDLHDQLGQQLTALRLKLASLKEACGDDEKLCAQVEAVQELAERVDSEVDFLVWELRPTALDDLGLVAALTNFVHEWSRHYNIPGEVQVTGFGSGGLRLPHQTETCLYRIAQEALNNVSKYSQAARIAVVLERRGAEVVLVVEDDGVGFDPEAKMAEGGSLGLVGMRERAALAGGSLEVESSHERGTTIYARVPVAPPEGGDARG